ncbi:glycerate kinase type-2 family protein [Chitinophaga nivalis]|uniref:Glycerate kinase n=1 Tax=Chitinophaga nivalis TaxID=2991709 RepID=A0ABT3IEG9_9BACT|nr:glycerate kinase [Chitinophaga nivalis]MCW3467956.1 glycerate kinase [Chitinophaga nivalis]MCW3482353.1 glycerate kinase [Chitinophaga nivalis]
MTNPVTDITHIFEYAVAAVHPAALIRNNVSVWQEHHQPVIRISGDDYRVAPDATIWITGAGKAAAAMAQELEQLLLPHFPLQGCIVTKYGHALPLQQLTLLEAGHPVPDNNSVEATTQLLALTQQVRPQDLVFFLLSGGASSLLADVPPGCRLTDVQQLFSLLLHSGADIREMNTVRKHISGIKGGRLAQALLPATVCTLILSDVVGDDLSVIGSGPTVPDPTTFADTLAILRKYHLTEKIPPALLQHIENGVAGKIADTPKPGSTGFGHVHNYLTGTNRIALEAAAGKAQELGYHPQLLAADTTGEVHTTAQYLVQQALQYPGPLPACLLMGGETTVTVTGSGKGGRNQQLALAAGIALADHPHITLLSGGTDGTDGPTDAAGAIVHAQTIKNALKLQLDPNSFLHSNDAWHFFSKAGGLLVTGPTQTNVMDLMIVLIAAEQTEI